MSLVGAAARVHHENSFRLAFRDFQIGIAHPSKKRSVFALKSVLIGIVGASANLIAAARAFNAGHDV
jgi:hypothetical protein